MCITNLPLVLTLIKLSETVLIVIIQPIKQCNNQRVQDIMKTDAETYHNGPNDHSMILNNLTKTH